MNYDQLKKESKLYAPALLLSDIVSPRIGKILLKVTLFAVCLLMIAGEYLGVTSNTEHLIDGLFFLGLAFLVFLLHATAFYNSYYFHALDLLLNESHVKNEDEAIAFEVSEILYHTHPDTITSEFVRSSYGELILLRVGITLEKAEEFLRSRKDIPDVQKFNLVCKDGEGGVSLFDYTVSIFSFDEGFRKFLFSHSIQESDFLGGARWVERVIRSARRHARFWSRENLGRIEGLAKDWAFGGAFTLKKFSRNVSYGEKKNMLFIEKAYLNDSVEQIETALAKDQNAHALLVGDDELVKKNILELLGQKISEGNVLAQLAHKELVILDANAVLNNTKVRAEFELLLVKILGESVRAGNIILVLEDLPAFMQAARALGSDIIALITPYVSSSRLQIIACSDTSPYHELIETNIELGSMFEKIQVRPVDSENIIVALEEQALMHEWKNGVFFTYPALEAIAQGAERYFTNGTPFDKALGILDAVIPRVASNRKNIIEKSDVLALLEKETGIPLGIATDEEKQKLINLESILHQRIVGQDEAVVGISNALRRARSGVANKDRPMGSFLFLGPTGVGKTETTKALAATFFGSQTKILRLDMSEYRTEDALDRLIGVFGSGKQGILSSLLRENPYGVLLLDEFEKTNKEVLDLFLQILDEGFFSDMTGKKVNARNLIIIATSNAGSEMIFDMVKEGKDLAQNKDAIIDSIISHSIFKPELLNRFDGVILFHPLKTEDLKKIAVLMLGALQKRLREKGIELIVNEVLLEVLLQAGTDPKFGARPMNRAIQEKVEQVIAKKLIQGDISAGGTLTLSSEDFNQK